LSKNLGMADALAMKSQKATALREAQRCTVP